MREFANLNKHIYQGYLNYLKNKTNDSNNIMIFMGSYIINKKEQHDYLTYERNPKADYRLYLDLETENLICVAKKEIAQFEASFITLYLPIFEYSKEEYLKKYNELKKWYNYQILYRFPKDVIKELQKKYERKYKNIYPLTQQIDTINNLPIDQHLQQYSKDGFIEEYCLSPEEKMVIKLYRRS